MPTAATNNSRNKYFQRMRQPHRKWDFYDAQPAHVKAWLQQLPTNVWPGTFDQITASQMADTERRNLAGLRAVWGDDHPAVIDASRRIQIKRNKIVETLSTDDLSDLF
jgi:hypothetical protein